MEKINKEELMKKLNLTEEELEKVAGGRLECVSKSIKPSESRRNMQLGG